MQTPNAAKWTADCRHLKTLAAELNRARNLVEAFNTLGRINATTDRLITLCDFPTDPCIAESMARSKKVLQQYAQGDNAYLLKEPFDLRANYGEIKDLILTFAQGNKKFTVDALGIWLSSRIGVVPRRLLSANLYSLATKGSKPLIRVRQGKKGPGQQSPAVYALRKR
jgi:hypothetical protein